METDPISSHRSRVDVIADILTTATEKKRKTNIMYSCNLSLKQLEVYLDLLLDKRFLRETPVDPNSSLFETTDKGKTFLSAYANLQALLKA